MNPVKKTLFTLLAILLSVLLVAIAGELATRLFLNSRTMQTWIEMHDRGFMMNQSGGSAYHQHRGREVVYHFSKSRLRVVHPPEETETNSDSYRILLLGDSFTYGLLLPAEKTMAHQLQQKADRWTKKHNLDKRIEIVNGGVGGSGTANMYAWLRHFGEETEPDMVIPVMNSNDVQRSISRNLYILPDYYSGTAQASSADSLIHSQRWEVTWFKHAMEALPGYRYFQKNSQLFSLMVNGAWGMFYFRDLTDNFSQQKSTVPIPDSVAWKPSQNYSSKLTHGLYQNMKSWCREREIRFSVATTGFMQPKKMDKFTAEFYQTADSFFSAQSIPFLDISQSLERKVGGDFKAIQIKNDSHPNEEGNALMAELLWNRLRPLLEEKILPTSGN